MPPGIDMYSVLMAATMDFIASYIFGLGQGTNIWATRPTVSIFLVVKSLQ